MTGKPLFIPLKREFFEAFENGTKKIEYRLFGPRWNHSTCTVGRSVTLSLGYGKNRRLTGKVTAFYLKYLTDSIPGWNKCYGENKGPAACIGITLTNKTYENQNQDRTGS